MNKIPQRYGHKQQSLADDTDDVTVATFQKRLLDWYRSDQRSLPWRKTSDPYHIWVSEVMLQQTQVSTVVDYFNRFVKRFPDIVSLAAADPDTVLKAWEGLGYYSRARNLQKAARELVSTGAPRVPDRPDQFILLPGVGDYINAAVQSIAFGHKLPVVDGNVKRVLARIFLKPDPINQAAAYPVYRELAALLLDQRDPGTWNQAMMELGALICKPRHPLCDQCPVHKNCGARLRHQVPDFPVRTTSGKIPVRRQTAGIIIKRGKLLLVRRPARGLLGGLWEFPGGPVEAGQSPEAACREAVRRTVGLTVKIETPLGRINHAYTHFKLSLDAFVCRSVSGRVRLSGPDDFCWIKPAALSAYPLHKAVHKLLPELNKLL